MPDIRTIPPQASPRVNRRRGGQTGNQNARKHGFHSRTLAQIDDHSRGTMRFDKTNQAVPQKIITGDESEVALSTKRIERIMRIDFLSGACYQIRKPRFLIEEKNGFLQNESPG